MTSISRRTLIGAGAAAVLGASAQVAAAKRERMAMPGADRVDLTSDGVALTAVEYAALVQRLTTASTRKDEYSLGGAVEDLERQFAALLDKEAAIFMPSGTLANHLAVRALAGTRRRVLVQERAHLYNDSGDCAQQLSGLALMPLAPGRAAFTWDEVEAEIARASGGRVSTGIGAISIESPVRRLGHAMFGYEAMARISTEARRRGIGLHLDGARLFVEAAYAERDPRDYARLFDTVYVSLWKCFNAGNGAVLAGPRALIDGMFHVRRQFGGAMRSAWPDALVAGHYANGYVARMRAAVAIAEQAWRALGNDPRFTLTRVPDGTSALKLAVDGVDPEAYRSALARLGVVVAPAKDGAYALQVNETVARVTAPALVDRFRRAITAQG